MTTESLTQGDRLLRAQALCVHCVRNIASYRASRNEEKERIAPRKSFWAGVEKNFLDMAVLEWCKLFGDPVGIINSKHSWENVVGKVLAKETALFRSNMLTALGLNEAEFEAVRLNVRWHRDKFVAHLDDENTITPPLMTVPLESSFYFYDFLRKAAPKDVRLMQVDLREAYKVYLSEAVGWYASAARQEATTSN